MQGSGLSQAGADRAAEVQVGLPTCQALFLEELLLRQLALLQVGAELEAIKLADEVGQEGEPVGGAVQRDALPRGEDERGVQIERQKVTARMVSLLGSARCVGKASRGDSDAKART